jgi:redox-sensitive bicupin YhaK (pirin superfamily)
MIRVRRSAERGHFDHGWLDTFHTFSFADYHDPAHERFRSLRVLNEDRVAAGKGFGMHPHRDMEILTVVLSGALRHEDSMGNGSVIRPGEIQRMSAGTGVLHSEWNASDAEPVHLLQIWIRPERIGLPPGYEEAGVPPAETRGRLRRIAARRAAEGEVTIHQDAAVYAADLRGGEAVEHSLAPGRAAWVQVSSGEVEVGGERLAAGDGAAIEGVAAVRLEAARAGTLLLFDLA